MLTYLLVCLTRSACFFLFLRISKFCQIPHFVLDSISFGKFRDSVRDFQAVRLESAHAQITRYMVVVSTIGRQDTEESVVLGMDFSPVDG